MLIYKRCRKIRILLAIVILLILLLIFFLLQVKPVFITLSKSKVYAVSLQAINNVINKKMSEINYNDLINYQKKENEEITIVNANIVLMNKLSNEISNEIINELNALEPLYINIPLGSISGSDILTGTGPEFKVKIIPISEVRTEFKTDFSSTGINQTRHKVILNVYCTVEALTTLVSNHINIELQIPILETVIIGGVPNTYYQIEGVGMDNIMQMMDKK